MTSKLIFGAKNRIFEAKNDFWGPKLKFCMFSFIYVCKMPNQVEKYFFDYKLRYLEIHPKWTIHVGYSWKCVIVICPCKKVYNTILVIYEEKASQKWLGGHIGSKLIFFLFFLVFYVFGSKSVRERGAQRAP